MSACLLHAETESLDTADDFAAALENFHPERYALVACTALPEIPAGELAQSLRMQAPGLPLIYVSPETEHDDVKALTKNGFDRAFFLPMDRALLEAFLRQCERAVTGQARVVFRSVPLMDLREGDKVDIEMYLHLPKNDKYVKIARAGAEIRGEQLDKLKSSGVGSLFVDETDMDRFCEYMAAKIKEAAAGSGSEPAVVKKERLRAAVRGMFLDLLAPGAASFDEGKEILGASHKIVETLIGGHVKEIRTAVRDLLGQDGHDIYAHSLRVSSLAALLSLALAVGKPEELAIAGLFHDLGLVKLPERLWFKDPATMSENDRQLYMQYPVKGIALLMEKKMVLLPVIQDAILQHQERADGKGFPKALPEHKISPEARLLRVADRLEELTARRPGHAPLAPEQALEFMRTEGTVSAELSDQVKALVS
jgi:hypothetical protein